MWDSGRSNPYCGGGGIRLQRADADLAETIEYVENRIVPLDPDRAQVVTRTGDEYTVKDGGTVPFGGRQDAAGGPSCLTAATAV